MPLFMTGILLPALFYRALPLIISVASVVVTTGLLAAGTPGPAPLRLTVWAGFTTIMGLTVVVIQRLATERRRTIEQLEVLASTDSLTRIANRRHFMERASAQLTEAHAGHTPCTLVLADIDHFKSVNDTHGHDVGDHVLVGVAAAMRDSARSDDVVARLGGEEFAILLVGATVHHAQHVAAEIARRLGRIDPVPVTSSFGIAEAKLGETDVSELLVRADTALYEAKASGRDRAVVAG
jgi:diguanylate cyclase (GGDEF)-like protein